MKRMLYVLLCLMLVMASLAVQTRSAAAILTPGAQGDLDAAFGTGGIVITDFGDSEWVNDLALLPDGKIVAVGNTSLDFALARYNSDGGLDSSFGTNGKVTTDFFGYEDVSEAVAIQADGKLVVAGTAYHADRSDFALARYHSNGSLDSSFGTNGKATINFDGYYNNGFDLVLQPDGKIVVAGRDSNNFAVARFNSNGTLDTSFSGDGKVTTDFGDGMHKAFAIALQTDGKIVAAGQANSPSDADFALARYNSDGSPDTGFGTNGMVVTELGTTNDLIEALTLQTDGKIVVVGFCKPGSYYNVALARYNGDGTLDAGFGTNGQVTTVFTTVGNNYGIAVATQSDGKIVVTGNGSGNLGLARFLSNGTLDNDFGTSGIVVTDLGGSDWSNAMVIQPDGKILAAGGSNANGTYDFTLVRYEGQAPNFKIFLPLLRR
jgi:uncharacterized delta-60 repeat protein